MKEDIGGNMVLTDKDRGAFDKLG